MFAHYQDQMAQVFRDEIDNLSKKFEKLQEEQKMMTTKMHDKNLTLVIPPDQFSHTPIYTDFQGNKF